MYYVYHAEPRHMICWGEKLQSISIARIHSTQPSQPDSTMDVIGEGSRASRWKHNTQAISPRDAARGRHAVSTEKGLRDWRAVSAPGPRRDGMMDGPASHPSSRPGPTLPVLPPSVSCRPGWPAWRYRCHSQDPSLASWIFFAPWYMSIV